MLTKHECVIVVVGRDSELGGAQRFPDMKVIEASLTFFLMASSECLRRASWAVYVKVSSTVR